MNEILHINTNHFESSIYDNMLNNFNENISLGRLYLPLIKSAKGNVNNQNIDYSYILTKFDRYRYFHRNKKLFKDINEVYDIRKKDLIIAYSLFSNGYLAYTINKKYCIPYIVLVQNTDLNFYFKHFIWLRKIGIDILMNAESIIFISEPYLNSVSEKYITLKNKELFLKKAKIIPFAIDDFWIENKNYVQKLMNVKDIKMVFVGKVNNNKNIISILRVCDILDLKGYNICLEIVGEIIDKSLEEVIISKKYINYIGYSKKEELLKIYRRNDIFIMPSIKESFGLVYAEAMSQGLPVIYTRNQGFDRHFKDGEVGYSVNALNVNEMVEKILLICEKYNEISKRCIQTVDKFSWKNVTNKYDNIINKF